LIKDWQYAPKIEMETTMKRIDLIMEMDLHGFHHHKRLTKIVRRDGDLGERQGRIPEI
jgi:hypothetical protein